MFALFLAILSPFAVAKPVRPPVDEAIKKSVIPRVAGDSVWGTLEQSDTNKLEILDHEQWHAEGFVRADGKIYLLWTERSTGRQGASIYQLHPDKTITGLWGWCDEVKFVKDNTELEGTVRQDTLRRKEEKKEDVD